MPIWGKLKDYPEDIEGVVFSLLSRSDKDYQIRVWALAEGPEVDWYDESSLNFDNHIEFFKKDIRVGKVSLRCEQVKAILRVHVMCNHFEQNLMYKVPENTPWTDEQLLIINHPYWDKIRKQATYALSLIRKV